LVHWFFIRKTERRTPSGITIGCYILLVVSVASIGLFSANSLYTGLLSDAIGGVDVGPYVGFVVAGLSYYGAFRLWPNKFKVMRIQK
jgi:purine-cytosine permease-like protein